MKLLHLALIALLAQLCAIRHSICAHRRQTQSSEQDKSLDDYNKADLEESSNVVHRGASWRRKILATKASSEWRHFKRAFKKNYSDDNEEDERIANYLATKELVARHNSSPGEKFKMAINHFADRSDEELERMNGYIRSNISHKAHTSKRSHSFLETFLNKPAPERWDWREHDGVLAPVKFQRQCGACWAFTAAALLEGQQKSIGMRSTQLSVQQLLDCEVKYSAGCTGGYIHSALDYVVSVGGIESWDTYPYEGARYQCRHKPDKFVMKGGSWISLDHVREDDLRKLVAHYGPVAVAMKAPKEFYLYSFGVHDGCPPWEQVDHAVVLVGYGQDGNTPYWLIKNSWDWTWGDFGYGKIKRGVNMCRIMEQPMIVRLGPQ